MASVKKENTLKSTRIIADAIEYLLHVICKHRLIVLKMCGHSIGQQIQTA
jgi:hypothetical protein